MLEARETLLIAQWFVFYANSRLRLLLFSHRSLFPKKVELQALMKHYDVDGDGSITYDEFLRGLR